MIARRKDSSAALAKPSDTLAVFYGKTITGINCEEPQLINVLMIQLTQEDIVACSIFLPITRHHLDRPVTICTAQRAEIFAQQRKALNCPIVFNVRNRGLQENSNGLTHMAYQVGERATTLSCI